MTGEFDSLGSNVSKIVAEWVEDSSEVGGEAQSQSVRGGGSLPRPKSSHMKVSNILNISTNLNVM